jgi:copper chaperone
MDTMTREKSATIRVNGMTCNGCVSSVTNAIKRVPGVREVQVSLDAKMARVVYAADETAISQIESAIVDAGYEPASHEVASRDSEGITQK